MTSKKSISGIVFLLVFLCSLTLAARDYYQIKVYTIKDKTQEASIDKYLKDAYLPALHKAGIKKVGVFKPIADDAAAGTKIFVLIPLKELNQIGVLEEKLLKDKNYLEAGSEYIDAKHDNPPYERIESIVLKAFAEMPELFVPKYDTPKSAQIFELRSYQGATEKLWRKKVEMFNEGGEIEIFKKVGSNAVFYGEVVSGSAMPNLMYMTSYSDMESNKAHWDAFRQHPDWLILKEKEAYKNTVSHIDKWLCHPTDYSDI
ncbi:NIPSNAP family protein [Prolixibacteraceae bacterium Z1-6]|uniref:NIPSNAP family protein n=1 Tax=Draconibacterium aestuarii TaxID=2998507 RepID=A0A9X3F3E2_9BACT|nr:NIPSNAP family protein [Prolixibacteraceae bacterium Z1-6]